MKNWLYFPMILMLLASCKNDKPIPAPTPEPVALDPVLTLAVSKNTVTTGDTLTVFCKTENAVRTENNIGAPTTPKWKYTFKITENQKIIVSAVNKVGKTVTSDKDVTAVAYVPTFADTLCAAPWYLKSAEILDKDNNVISYSELSEAQKTKKCYYFKDGFLGDSNGVKTSTKWSWDKEKKILMNGDQFYFPVILKDKELIRYRVVGEQKTRDTYWRP